MKPTSYWSNIRGSMNIAVLPTVSDVSQTFAAEMPEVLYWNENAAECLQLLCQWKRKTDVFACERKEVWDNFGGFSAETILKIASWCLGPGAVMCECVYCMRACVYMCVRVWACRHVLRQVINQCKRVTLSSAWKPLCSLKPDWFLSGGPRAAAEPVS